MRDFTCIRRMTTRSRRRSADQFGMTKGEWNQIVPLALVFRSVREHQTQLDGPGGFASRGEGAVAVGAEGGAAVMQTTMIRASMTAYSTAGGPLYRDETDNALQVRFT